MGTHIEPTVDEWKALYGAANVFYKSNSWKWMYDRDIFGVEDPETGEVIFCCIMGNTGEHFALGGYIGLKGLDGVLQLLSGQVDADSPDVYFLQNCLMCSFEDRLDLEKRDRAIIRSLGLKYRGRNAWPLFRVHETGYPPWFLSARQCRSLTHVLMQANDVANRCRQSKDLIEHHDMYSYFVRVCSQQENGKIVWQDAYRDFEPYDPLVPSVSLKDEVLVQRLRSMPVDRNLALEADFFYLPNPLLDKERPYYPMVCALLDSRTGTVVSVETIADGEQERYRFVDLLQRFIVKGGKRPSQVMVSRPEAYLLFVDMAQQIGLRLEHVSQLTMMPILRQELTESLS